MIICAKNCLSMSMIVAKKSAKLWRIFCIDNYYCGIICAIVQNVLFGLLAKLLLADLSANQSATCLLLRLKNDKSQVKKTQIIQTKLVGFHSIENDGDILLQSKNHRTLINWITNAKNINPTQERDDIRLDAPRGFWPISLMGRRLCIVKKCCRVAFFACNHGGDWVFYSNLAH